MTFNIFSSIKTNPVREIALPSDCEMIQSGAFSQSEAERFLLPESICSIDAGAFDADCTAEFWCVKDSYAAERIAELCSDAVLELFDSYKDMLLAWENPKYASRFQRFAKPFPSKIYISL